MNKNSKNLISNFQIKDSILANLSWLRCNALLNYQASYIYMFLWEIVEKEAVRMQHQFQRVIFMIFRCSYL